MDVAWVALGAGAGALAVWLTAKEAARRRGRFPSYEVWAWAAYLVGAALIYVGFAVFNGASAEWTWTELGGLAGDGLAAWIAALNLRFARLRFTALPTRFPATTPTSGVVLCPVP